MPAERLPTLNPAFVAKLEQRKAEKGAGAAGERPPAPDARACVLVVDDEPEITASVAELLGRDYRVLTAGSADEALALLHENKDRGHPHRPAHAERHRRGAACAIAGHRARDDTRPVHRATRTSAP